MRISFSAARKPERKKSVAKTTIARRFEDESRSFGAISSDCAIAGECIRESGNQSVNDCSRDVCQPIVAAAESICQLCMVKSAKMQDGGMQIVDVDRLFDGSSAKLIRRAVHGSGVHAPACE